VPGLVPGIVGLMMMLLGAVLAWRAWRRMAGSLPGPTSTWPPALPRSSATSAPSESSSGSSFGSSPEPPSGPSSDSSPESSAASSPEPSSDPPANLRRALPAAALCLLFGGVLTGRGLPFAAVAAGFILVFILAFGWRELAPGGSVLHRVAMAAAIAVLAAGLIAWLFGSVFLVRLP
jgi:hypothetical protein